MGSFRYDPIRSQRAETLIMKLLLCLMGLVMVVEGIPYFAFPGKMKQWMLAVQKIPNPYLRTFGLLTMGLGLLLAYLFRE
jgi:uncharacterized protein YjeT (DUF2065 family)